MNNVYQFTTNQCLNNNIVYKSVKDAYNKLNLSLDQVYYYLKNPNNRKMHFEYYDGK